MNRGFVEDKVLDGPFLTFVQELEILSFQAQDGAPIFVKDRDRNLHELSINPVLGAFLTQGDHSTGSDRIGEAIQGRSERIILNIQGDEPLVPSGAIDSLVELLECHPQAAVSTLACSLEADSPEHLDPNVVKVVCDDEGRALYFSRAPIPGCHPTAMASQRQAHRHVGLYGFRRDAFEGFLGREAGELERAEGLEQLRFLVAGQTIVVGTLDAVPPGVDTPEDLARCAALLRD